MHPKEFIKIRESINVSIAILEHQILKFQEQAMKFLLPNNLIPATSKDIVVGNIIWYKDSDNGPFWNIIQDVHRPDDDFKAYTTEDGCRYGLMNAFIEKV